MSATSYTERLPAESPLLWPAIALLVIAIGWFTYYWDTHRSEFPYYTAYGPVLWPPPPQTLQQPATTSPAPSPAEPSAPVPAAPSH